MMYWVGGTGNWSDAANHWATSSGGSPDAGNLPTSSDDVTINSSSGFGSGGTITLDGVGFQGAKDFTSSSGHTYTITGASERLEIYGSMSLEDGLTLSNEGIGLKATTTGKTLTTDGVVLPKLQILGIDGGWTLQDNLEITEVFYIENGTFDANDKNVKVANCEFYADTDMTPTIIMGSGTWEITSHDDFMYVFSVNEYSGETVTITPETSTIKLTDATANVKTFKGGGKTYKNLCLSGGGTGNFIILGANTFNNFKVDTPPHTVLFEGGKTQTVSSWTVIGSAGNLITINGLEMGENIDTHELNDGGSSWAVDDFFYVDAGNKGAIGYVTAETGGVVTSYDFYTVGADYSVANAVNCVSSGSGTGLKINILSITASNIEHTLSCVSDVIRSNYLNISNSNTTGGARWLAGNYSTNTTNNTGWIFTKVKGIIGGGILPYPR